MWQYVLGQKVHWIPISETTYSIEFLLCNLEAKGYVWILFCKAITLYQWELYFLPIHMMKEPEEVTVSLDLLLIGHWYIWILQLREEGNNWGGCYSRLNLSWDSSSSGWGFLWFSWVPQGLWQDSTIVMTTSFQILSNSLLTNHTIQRYIAWDTLVL
jgi:hypothetical protein